MYNYDGICAFCSVYCHTVALFVHYLLFPCCILALYFRIFFLYLECARKI